MTFTIKTGPHQGSWKLMHATGFGSKGQSAQFRRIDAHGQILKGYAGGKNTMNLTPEQVAQVQAA